ncbi:hypothetical protein [Zhongshania sp.]|uniref:hypothetical protein n=1 Tax=Zhongshania sp. TaxID=1971902 RepID=UPI00356B3E22
MRIKRTGPTVHGKFTHGRVYPVINRTVNSRGEPECCILNDVGTQSTAMYQHSNWEILPENSAEEAQKKMKKITVEKRTYVNGECADGMSSDHIIGLISMEREKVERLQQTGIKSDAVKKLCERHLENIAVLEEVLNEVVDRELEQ